MNQQSYGRGWDTFKHLRANTLFTATKLETVERHTNKVQSYLLMVAYAEADVKVLLYMVFDSSNWIVLFFVYLYHFLVLFFANDRYDDGCHLLGRAMSLIGTCWMAAAVCCLAIFIDKFHITNYTDAWCVGALNPYRFRGIDEANTERSITSHL